MTSIDIQYNLKLGDHDFEYIVRLDPNSIEQQIANYENIPEWARLEAHQCSNCPYTVNDHEYCPPAINLIPLIEFCANLDSFDNIKVIITTSERVITAETSIQNCVRSLLGLIMATSSCEYMKFLRPMARFHQPLASREETIYRSVATYLLGQYFRSQRDGINTIDTDLSGLRDIYNNLQMVNKAMTERLRSASEKDASVNAVIVLDIMAKSVNYSIDDALEDIRYLFEPYLNQQ